MVLVRTRPLLPDVVRAELRRLIIEGEFPPGSKLPNEDALCQRFAVSRITLREAVRGLIEEGYVVRRQGAGTFVTVGPALRNSLDTNFSYTEYLESTGLRVIKRVLEATRTMPSDEVSSDLGLGEREEVVVVRRLRIAGKTPAIYSIDTIPADIVDAKGDLKEFGRSLYRLLASRGHVIDHGRSVLTPVVANTALAEILEVPRGTPLQHMRQVDYDSTGRPVMRSLEWHVPSVIELRVFRRGPGPVAVGEV